MTEEPDAQISTRAYLKRWGFGLGSLHVTWWDLWAGKPCFEVVWDG
jgi:hypothetical protein